MGFEVTADQRKQAEEQSFAPIPKGVYRCQIEKAEEKLNKDEREMLSLKCRIMDGEKKDKYLFINIIYDLKFASALMKSLIESAGGDWEKIKTVTPELMQNKIIYIEAPGGEGFNKTVAPPKVEEKVTEDDGDVPF